MTCARYDSSGVRAPQLKLWQGPVRITVMSAHYHEMLSVAVCKDRADPYSCWKLQDVKIYRYLPTHVTHACTALPSALIEVGAVDVFRGELLAMGSLYGAHVPGYVVDTVDIDTTDDFEYAEFLRQQRSERTQPTR
jgi:hypothetical protein